MQSQARRVWARRLVAVAMLASGVVSSPGCDRDAAPGEVALALEDVNPTSMTFGQRLSPDDLLGEASAWYFTRATCPYCTRQYGLLDALAASWSDAHPDRPLVIVAVNHDDARAGLDRLVGEGDLPILQDTATGLWAAWEVSWRDLVVRDAQGAVVGIINLTDHDLAEDEHRATLDALLLEATDP